MTGTFSGTLLLRALLVMLTGSGWLVSVSEGASVLLRPVADTSLLEVAPTNNNGAQEWVLAGTTQNGPRTRGLFRFDLSSIPSNALIQSVSLTVSVTRQPGDDFEVGTFSLHRMLRPWGEGAKSSLINPGKGEPASEGEATWLHSHYPTNAWTTPGGASGADYFPWESAFQTIYGVNESPFVFESTPEFVDDVQGWVNNVISNYGWILICNEEGTPFTGRRFGSREDAANAPILQVDYVVQPVLREPQKSGDYFEFWFVALPGHNYAIEYQDIGSTAWKSASDPIQDIAEETEISLWFPLVEGGRLYRIRAF